MTTLTQPQWHALTYIQHYERRHLRPVRYADVQAGCGFSSRAQTRDVINFLAHKGLVEEMARRMNGHTVWFARSNKSACGTVGVSYE